MLDGSGINAGPVVSSPRPRVGAWLLVAVGVALLVTAFYLPWVSLRFEPRLSSLLAGEPAAVTVRTYDLTALPGAAVLVVADWVVLLGLFAVSRRVPRWRRRLVGISMAVLGILLFLILGQEQVATQASGRAGDYPRPDLLAGAYLALLGAALVAVAVGVPRVKAVPAAPRPDPPATAEDFPEPASGPEPAFGWSARPVWQPWWRRRGPVTALVAGLGAVVLVAGTAAWLAIRSPSEPVDSYGDLRAHLLPAPAGATPLMLGGQNAATGPDRVPLAALAEDSDVRQAVYGGWIEPSGRDRVGIGLVRFTAKDEAHQTFDALLLAMARLTDQAGKEVPGVPGAQSLLIGSDVEVIGEHDDVLFAIAGSGASVSAIDALARQQYDLL